MKALKASQRGPAGVSVLADCRAVFVERKNGDNQ